MINNLPQVKRVKEVLHSYVNDESGQEEFDKFMELTADDFLRIYNMSLIIEHYNSNSPDFDTIIVCVFNYY